VNVTVLAKFVPSPTGTPQLGPDNLLVRAVTRVANEQVVRAELRRSGGVRNELGEDRDVHGRMLPSGREGRYPTR